jgi:hypothetical protein
VGALEEAVRLAGVHHQPRGHVAEAEEVVELDGLLRVDALVGQAVHDERRAVFSSMWLTGERSL